MSRFLAVGAAVLRKDCRELWPHAAPTAVLFALDSAALVGAPWREVTHPSAQLLVAILIVRLLQSDAPSSTRHDWLTRPISWPMLLAAKAAFMLLWLGLPDILGGTVKALNAGYAPSAALLEGLRQSVPSPAFVVVLAAAVITSSMWSALLIPLGTAWLCQFAIAIISFRFGTGSVMDARDSSFDGTGWMQESSLSLLAVVACPLILWQQYVRRQTVRARAIYAGTVVLALLATIVLRFHSHRFALQRLGSAAVAVELQPGCFASRRPADFSDVVQFFKQVTPRDRWSAKQLYAMWTEMFGDSIVFSTVLTERERAGADRMMVAHAQASYLGADGRRLFSVQGFAVVPQLSTTDEGKAAATHYWFLPRARYQELQALADVRLQIDYSVSLLAPEARAVVPTDERRALYAGRGHCGAYPQTPSNHVLVECFTAGPWPALLHVNAAGGAPGLGATSVLDFTPVLLKLFAEQRHQVSWTLSGERPPSHVQVTAYRARAHFQSRVIAPGILGGSKEACPAPAGM